MKQHPVPQNITSYQFRLVGEMTLKQFLELAAGVVTAYLLLHLNLPAFLKWPLVVFFGLLGFALAFLPVQERPLDRWIINFIKSIYAPTTYIWRKNNPAPDFLQPKTSSSSLTTTATIPKKDVGILREYLATLAPTQTGVTFDQEELNQLSNIKNLFGNLPAATAIPIKKIVPSPLPPPAATAATPSPGPRVLQAPPLTPPIRVDTLFPVKQKLKPEIAALFPQTLPMPATSDKPNLIVGMVVGENEEILPNCLIEIKDKGGNTIRALKTNKLGQFFTAAPLENGEYNILAENDQYQFAIIKLKAEGKIIPPLKIKALKKISIN